MLSNEYLVRGALLKCRCGSHERKLNILKDHGVYVEEKPLAHKLDKLEFENIMSFGVCSSDSKYLKSECVLL
ncbi:PAAR-like protein [[Clostridium] colinum]|uniref:PAAR-like protein n=1 Tax=[Clostridium] colinum TaxID=36835 RepID=UPI0024E0BB98|nr:PAAR-like protein [[Clostridium] colinum]